ncbi:hypothetical protein [Halomicroarcula sp. GCM10025743]|uniref:hypothetical protein n=1 Tax=Haloarcula TaxID=2237 RepID=UPI00361E5351
MCGIIAANGTDPDLESVLRGLQNLEYRGYDSAEVAVGLGDSPAVCKHAGQISGLLDDVCGELPDRTWGHRAHPMEHPRTADRCERPPAHGL